MSGAGVDVTSVTFITTDMSTSHPDHKCIAYATCGEDLRHQHLGRAKCEQATKTNISADQSTLSPAAELVERLMRNHDPFPLAVRKHTCKALDTRQLGYVNITLQRRHDGELHTSKEGIFGVLQQRNEQIKRSSLRLMHPACLHPFMFLSACLPACRHLAMQMAFRAPPSLKSSSGFMARLWTG